MGILAGRPVKCLEVILSGCAEISEKFHFLVLASIHFTAVIVEASVTRLLKQV